MRISDWSSDVCSSDLLWRRAFALTYSAELRAERRTRAASVVEADPERYRRFTGPAVEAAGIGSLRDTELSLKPVGAGSRRRAERLWEKRRRAGKALAGLRLATAKIGRASCRGKVCNFV